MTRFIYFGIALLVTSSLARAETRPKRYLMAIFGDSISAASLAQTNAHKDSVDALGVSYRGIRQISDELQHGQIPFYENKYTLSWGSGTTIASHYTKLKLWFWENVKDVTLNVKNYAIPGSTTDSLDEQLDRLAEDLSQYDALVYVGITIGSNDACSTETFRPATRFEGLPNTRFTSNLERFVQRLSGIKQDFPLRVLFHSIPKIADLGFSHIMDFQPAAKGYSCRFIRTHLFTYCPVLSFWSTESQYQEFSQIVVDKNELLKKVVDDSNARYPQMSLFYSRAMFDAKMDPRKLAVDCFHPNAPALSLLSETSFDEQPWYKFNPGVREMPGTAVTPLH